MLARRHACEAMTGSYGRTVLVLRHSESSAPLCMKVHCLMLSRLGLNTGTYPLQSQAHWHITTVDHSIPLILSSYHPVTSYSSSSHLISLYFHHLLILSSCHLLILSFCHLLIISSSHPVITKQTKQSFAAER
ncbi:hypothetical protein K474DRAFT_403626 [Panus rudis PR-1116 ss-1]|nr:hypothetical protein K474DRAFT_403626 [Panus rudis PR-1116 ss-1]